MWERDDGKAMGREGRVTGVGSSGHGQRRQCCFQSTAHFEVACTTRKVTLLVLSTSANSSRGLSLSLLPSFFCLLFS